MSSGGSVKVVLVTNKVFFFILGYRYSVARPRFRPGQNHISFDFSGVSE